VADSLVTQPSHIRGMTENTLIPALASSLIHDAFGFEKLQYPRRARLASRDATAQITAWKPTSAAVHPILLPKNSTSKIIHAALARISLTVRSLYVAALKAVIKADKSERLFIIHRKAGA
jgi:hypothetical protein